MTAPAPAEAVLRETSTEGLLRAFAALTHRMGDGPPAGTSYRTDAQTSDLLGELHAASDLHRGYAASLRAQRNLIRDEILRRTGDAR